MGNVGPVPSPGVRTRRAVGKMRGTPGRVPPTYTVTSWAGRCAVGPVSNRPFPRLLGRDDLRAVRSVADRSLRWSMSVDVALLEKSPYHGGAWVRWFFGSPPGCTTFTDLIICYRGGYDFFVVNITQPTRTAGVEARWRRSRIPSQAEPVGNSSMTTKAPPRSSHSCR